MTINEPLADWERELLYSVTDVTVTPIRPRQDRPTVGRSKMYRVVDLREHRTLLSPLTLREAWSWVDALRKDNPQMRLDIRTEWS